MSVGTAYNVGQNKAASGANSISFTYGATFFVLPASGDTIAVFVSSNASSNNISNVTDTQNNTFTAVNPVVGTSLNGQWFVASNVNAPSATDTCTAHFTGTGGSKVIAAFGCSGLAKVSPFVDLAPAGTVGSSTAPSETVGTPANANELILMAEANAGAAGAFTLTGSWSPPDSSQTGIQNASAQIVNIYAKTITSASALTASGTLANTGNWIVSAITLLPIPAPPVTTKTLVGATVPDLALKPLPTPCSTNPAETCYDAGLTQSQADTRFCTLVQRGLGSPAQHLTFTKKFWANVSDYNLGKNDLAHYIQFGTKVLFALTPPLTGGTAADQNALATFLTGLKNLGFNASNACIVLWQEPENGNHFGNGPQGTGTGPPGYQTQMAFFGPTVNASGLPLAQDVGMGGGDTLAQNYLNHGYAAPGVTFQAQYADFYFGAWSNGTTLNNVAAIADAQGVSFGLGEFGARLTDNNGKPIAYAAYFNYITGFFQGRQLAGKLPHAGLEYYQGQCSATGIGDLTSPILSSSDPRIPLFQNMYDTLTNIPVPNTITVTNPGNQTATAGTPITPLQITATDSDPSQTLTFTATGLPTGLVISSSGLISGTPSLQGVNNVTVTATDGTGASGSTGFTWNVSPIVTNTVTVTNPGNQSTQEGSLATLQMAATDSNVSLTTFTWGAAGLPTGLSINSSTGLISGTPSQVGSNTVTISATDVTGSSGNATFTWTVTNPNVLTHGQFVTLAPVAPSQIGGLGPAQQLSYELAFGLVAGSGSTVPWCAVILQFYDFDALTGLQTPVSTVTFRCPMGTINDPNGSAVVYGRGPMRGAFMRVQIHNVDTVDGTLAFFQLVGVSRNVDRDDWRFDVGGNAPVIPGYVNAQAAPASLLLAGEASLSIVHGTGNHNFLCSMFAGQASLRVHLFTGGPTTIKVNLIPQPVSLWTGQDGYSLIVGNPGTDNFYNVVLARGVYMVQIVADATTDASISLELIAIET